MMGSAPRILAPTTADRPTPPTPKMATESPFCTLAVLSTAPAPVITAQPMIAVTSRLDVRPGLDDELAVRNGVVGPGKDVLRHGIAAADAEVCRGRWRADGFGIAWHPGDEHDVALLHVRHLRALRDHLAGGFVAEQHRPAPGPVHLVQLRVAHARRRIAAPPPASDRGPAGSLPAPSSGASSCGNTTTRADVAMRIPPTR